MASYDFAKERMSSAEADRVGAAFSSFGQASSTIHMWLTGHELVVSGARSDDQKLAKILDDADGPSVAFVCLGTNDMRGATTADRGTYRFVDRIYNDLDIHVIAAAYNQSCAFVST